MVRIATFNVENLFARYDFTKKFISTRQDGFTINDLAFSVHSEEGKRITAQAIKEVDADVVCLQEVEAMHVLERFNSDYLGTRKYPHLMLLDSHDPRFIDVAVLSRHPFANLRTHRQERTASGRAWLFSRDCLEVDLNVEGRPLTLYVNHFKSMIGGRAKTRPRREDQVRRVAEIIRADWSGKGYRGNFAVLGDFNDFRGDGTALDTLLGHEGLVDASLRLDQAERWTHFYGKNKEYRQLDYILLSKGLAEANPQAKPGILRKGLPRRADLYAGPRFKGVGDNAPKASDHAPLFIDVELLG